MYDPTMASVLPQRRSVRFAKLEGVPELMEVTDSRRSLTDSRRSVGSTGSSSNTSGSLKAGERLGSSMTRHHHNKDPLFYYEVLNVLGAGSMGYVAKVKKRDNAVGGSARKEVVASLKKVKKREECFHIPVFGPFFQFCMNLRDNTDSSSSHHCAVIDSGDSTRSLTTVDSGDSGTTSRKSLSNTVYAMKSIHLSRIKDKTFVSELQNEIEILKKLDHPHIVRPVETFLHRGQIFVIMECCSG